MCQLKVHATEGRVNVPQSVTTFRNSCVEHVRPRSRELREASNGRRSRLRIRHLWTDSAYGKVGATGALQPPPHKSAMCRKLLTSINGGPSSGPVFRSS